MNFYNLHRIIASNNTLNNGFSKESQLYLFTTENINEYIKYLKTDSVLCPTASSDHAIISILNGCKRIETFDINEYARYLQILKMSAIKNLELDDFKTFFLYKDKGINEDVLSKKIYKKKLRKDLDKETKIFWDTCYDICKSGLRLRRSGLFLANTLDAKNQMDLCNYFDINSLKYLKKNIEILEKAKYYNTDIFSIANYLENTFSTIMLSNIQDYVDKEEYREFILNKLMFFLEKHGTIQTEYYYGNSEFNKIKNLSNNEYNINGYSSYIFDKKTIKDKCLILKI